MQWYYGSGPTVEDADGDPGGCIRVVADGKLLTRALVGDRAARYLNEAPAGGLPEANQPFDSFGEGRSVSGEILETILRLRPLNTASNQREPTP